MSQLGTYPTVGGAVWCIPCGQTGCILKKLRACVLTGSEVAKHHGGRPGSDPDTNPTTPTLQEVQSIEEVGTRFDSNLAPKAPEIFLCTVGGGTADPPLTQGIKGVS